MSKLILKYASPAQRLPIIWQDTGKALTINDVFRVSFAGVAMETGLCVLDASFIPSHFGIQSGDLNDFTYDIPFFSCSSPQSALFAALNQTGIIARWGGDSSYVFVRENLTVSIQLLVSGAFAGYLCLRAAYPGQSYGPFLYEGVFDPCDLVDGLVIANRLTGIGTYVSVGDGVTKRTLAYDGNATLTRVC